MGKDTVEITDANFEGVVLESELPVLVDLWAEWCMPCKAIGPSVDELATEFAGQAIIGKLNVDENPVVPTRYGIMGLPMLLIFKNGEIVEQMAGAKPKKFIKGKLEATLAG